MILFSVIIPVYNAEQTIDRCVESIFPDKNPDTEVLLIEDCSKDGSLRRCLMLEKKYDNVICLCNEVNRGVSYTRNRGLEVAQGRFFLFLDSDDWYAPDYISCFRKVIQQHEIKLAVCGYINHDEKYNGRTEIFGWEDFDGSKIVPLKSVIMKLYDGRLLQQLWNKLFVAQYIRQYGLHFDESISIGEDTRFLLQYLKCCEAENVLLLNQPLYHYMRDQEGSLMYRVGYESVEEPIRNLRLLYELAGVPEQECENELIQKRTEMVELYAYLIVHNVGMMWKERKQLVTALKPEGGTQLFCKHFLLYWKEKARKKLLG